MRYAEHMKRSWFRAAAGLLLAVASPAAWAALPPEHQRIAEFRAILDSADVMQALAGRSPIDRIEHVAPDRYRVTAGTCVLDVRIQGHPLPQGMVGPRRFSVVPETPSCR